jgi:hypothetical protein
MGIVNILLFLLMMLLAKRLPFCRCAGNVGSYFERKETDSQRNRFFPANQVNDDDIELRNEKVKVLRNF